MTGPPTQDSGFDVRSSEELRRYEWLTADRQAQVRNILLGLALFAGLVVYVYHSFGPQPRALALARKLLIALWRMVTTGEVPAGVVLRAA